MGAKGKGGEKGRNGVGVGPCLHQTMRKEDTLMYPEQSARRVPSPPPPPPPSYLTATLDSSLLDLRNQSKLDSNQANPGKLIFHNQPALERPDALLDVCSQFWSR